MGVTLCVRRVVEAALLFFIVEAAPKRNVTFISSSFQYLQLNLSLYGERVRPFQIDLWKNTESSVYPFLISDPADVDWNYRDEYVNILLQGHRSLQAYQTQRFILGKDIISSGDFADEFLGSVAETAISVTLSHVVDIVASDDDLNTVCFFGDVSFQHLYQLSQGCPMCYLHHYSCSVVDHAVDQVAAERLRGFMQDPSLFETDTLSNMLLRVHPPSCDVAYFHDSVWLHYAEVEIPVVGALVVLDVADNCSKFTRDAIEHSITSANPSVFWHSTAHHYMASTMILDFDSNGFVYRKMGTNIFLDDHPREEYIRRIQFGFVQRPQRATESLPTVASKHTSCPVVVITYTNRVFHETALGFLEAIKAIGVENVEVWGDMYQAFTERYTRKHNPSNISVGVGDYHECALPLQVAIAPHEDCLLLPHYVVLHLEQTWSVFSTRDMRYKRVVENAMSVWLMSWNGMQSFSGLAIDASRMYVVPLYTRFDYAQKTLMRLQSANGVDDRVDKVSILGSHSRRRESILSELHPLAEYLWGAVSDPGGLFFSRERDMTLLRYSKVILNIHSEDESSLEVHRINTLLAHGCCVVSERGSDLSLTQKYEGVVVFADRKDLLTTVSKYLFDDAARRAVERMALQFALDMQQDLGTLETAVVDVLRDRFFSDIEYTPYK